MSSIKDVAKMAGVSISTASNVINNSRYVSEELTKRVLNAVEELNYHTDFIARNMKVSSTMVLGVIVPSLKRIFVLPVMNGIQNIATNHGYNLSFFASDDNFKEEKKSIRALVSSRVDGIIIDSVASYDNKDYFESLASLKKNKKKIPVLSLERNLTHYGITSISVDNVKGGYLATAHLIDKKCSKIVHVTGPSYSNIVQDRIKGYKKALLEAGIEFSEDLIVKGDFSPLSGYRAIKRLILNGISFDSIFASNDQMAIGALKAIKEHNIRVPDDIKIIGFDNTFVSSIVEPSLTSVNVPEYRIGTSAVKCMLEILAKKEDNRSVYSVEIPISIVERASTGNNYGPGWELEYW